ncbi:hypothetical protein [Dyadobacter fermentans]|uniref:Uncharacterized protein n=1 Tax=Dyadobacter fermentans (strain ATCC 700827 / DSM 18053 / CIP 107007 / KCTC 52180 / NS114) TaxID=471854 RepID=C6W1M5_DYAFD|nr:hypothetical protein [Dyadobacter fermentans]ACT93755.1 hypothetical protein Dfer_2537 [Dyadobacter fermentans DSM 18053]
MQRTLIGIFESAAEARQALEALLTAGFRHHIMEVSDHVDTADDRLTDGQMTDTTDPPAADDGTLAPEKTGAILTIRLDDADEILRATEIMDDFGAMDINEFTKP